MRATFLSANHSVRKEKKHEAANLHAKRNGGSYRVPPALLLNGCGAKPDYDLIITGGTVYDGSGGPGRIADVAVSGGQIAAIATAGIPVKRAKDVIEAKGMAVAPGFIDPHTHTDVQILANPKGESKIRQGITTEVGGNCGYSYFPFSDQSFEEARKSVEKEFGVTVDWRDIKGLFSRLEKSGTAFNYATFLGQGSLRDAVMGPYDRTPKPEEMERMKQLIRENIEAGALGLTTGLQYTPGCFAKADELTELCHAVARIDGVYATHMRSEEDFVLEAVDETIVTAGESGVKLEISHLKANYPRNWAKMDAILAKLDKAAEAGIRVTADRYPYIASATDLNSFFPDWAR